MFEAVFEVTLQMITRNFEDYPEHRLQFFALLHAIVNHCFRCVFTVFSIEVASCHELVSWNVAQLQPGWRV